MRVSVERLRVWLLVGAGLLVVATAAFLGYARYRAKSFLTELPKRLGADIRQETNAFTYSQTAQGRTIFTVHAAKAVQHKDGNYTLHDVGIVLYGQKQSNRVDRIYGSEFTYEPNAGVIRAAGEVHLDLQAPEAKDSASKMDYAAGKDLKGGGAAEEEGKDERLIHVKTRGLVFMRELGVAATDGDIEFQYGGLTGRAKGADYSSDSGVLTLHSDVKVNGLEHEQPVVLTASRAELDRTNHRVTLAQAKYVTVGNAGQQAAEARSAVVHLREDGSAERMEAEGAVTVTRADGDKVIADRAEARLNAASQPQWGRMYGGVKYVADLPERQAHGEAKEAEGNFDAKGRLQKVTMRGGVGLVERVAAADGAARSWSERELHASTMEMSFAAGEGKAQPGLREVVAEGGARMKLTAAGKAAAGKAKEGPVTSEMSGDEVVADFAQAEGGARLEVVKGTGHTVLRRMGGAGLEQTSSGDRLEVRFRPASKGAGAAQVESGVGRVEIASAVQEGNVVLTRRKAAGKAGEPADVERATAAKVVYDGDSDRAVLTGGVQMSDATGTMWADKVSVAQETGDAVAEGSVKASYRRPGEAEPVHVLAARAEVKRDWGQAVFTGGTSPGSTAPARLWQGGSQVEAPVLEFTQTKRAGQTAEERKLVARGNGRGAALPVHTVLVSGGKASGEKKGAARGGGVLRVASREMAYSDAARTAVFSGGVVMESADGTMKGREATAYLVQQKAQEAKAAAVPAGMLGGSVEKVVVSGAITMEQAGRSATGEQLVYTAADETFVLTGRPGELPRVTDQSRGTVTGAELRFRTGDESVVISKDGAGSERVHTETQVKKTR